MRTSQGIYFIPFITLVQSVLKVIKFDFLVGTMSGYCRLTRNNLLVGSWIFGPGVCKRRIIVSKEGSKESNTANNLQLLLWWLSFSRHIVAGPGSYDPFGSPGIRYLTSRASRNSHTLHVRDSAVEGLKSSWKKDF